MKSEKGSVFIFFHSLREGTRGTEYAGAGTPSSLNALDGLLFQRLRCALESSSK